MAVGSRGSDMSVSCDRPKPTMLQCGSDNCLAVEQRLITVEIYSDLRGDGARGLMVRCTEISMVMLLP